MKWKHFSSSERMKVISHDWHHRFYWYFIADVWMYLNRMSQKAIACVNGKCDAFTNLAILQQFTRLYVWKQLMKQSCFSISASESNYFFNMQQICQYCLQQHIHYSSYHISTREIQSKNGLKTSTAKVFLNEVNIQIWMQVNSHKETQRNTFKTKCLLYFFFSQCCCLINIHVIINNSMSI